MIDEKLTAVLRCPLSGQSLKIADESLISAVNAAIDQGKLRDHREQKIQGRLEGGLVTADQRRLYPIRDQIPTMIIDESIPLSQISSLENGG